MGLATGLPFVIDNADLQYIKRGQMLRIHLRFTRWYDRITGLRLGTRPTGLITERSRLGCLVGADR
jgi:hypothetical protein